MKYEIEIMVASVTEDNKNEIRKILDGDIYDVISYSESGRLSAATAQRSLSRFGISLFAK